MNYRKKTNKESIVSIEVIDKHEAELIWIEYPDTWWNRINNRVSGFQSSLPFIGDIYSVEELKNGEYNDIKFLVEENVVYYKPYVKIQLCTGLNKIKTFDTYDECHAYAKRIENECGVNFIEL